MNEQLVIESIDKQFIPIDLKDYELEIQISGNPESAVAAGNMEAFYQDWDASNNILRIKSEEVLRLIVDAIWIIAATKTVTQSGMQVSLTATSDILYDVVLNTPVIEDPGNQTIYKGTLFYLDILIGNRPALSIVNGLLTGMIYNPLEAGVNISGVFPKDANVTQEDFDARVYTENDAGNDELDVPFVISDEDPVYTYLLSSSRTIVFRFNPDGILAWESLSTDGHHENMFLSRDAVYLNNESSSSIEKFNIYDGVLAWAATLGRANGEVINVDRDFINVITVSALYKINSYDGAEIWSTSHGGYNIKFNTYDSFYTLNVLPANLTRYSLDTGEQIYQAAVQVGNYTTRVFTSEALYLFGNIGFNTAIRMYKYSLIDGSFEWQYILGVATYLRPIFVHERNAAYTFATSVNSRRLYKINLSDGSAAWDYQAPTSSQGYNYHISKNGIYLYRRSGGNGIKINEDDGSVEWSISNFRVLHSTSDGAYGKSGSNLIKRNSSDGSESWSYNFGSSSSSSQNFLPNSTDDILYVLVSNTIYKLRSNGTLIWSYIVPSGFLSSKIEYTSGDYLYFIASNVLYRLDLSNGTVDWSYSLTTGIGVYGNPMIIT